MEPPELVPGAGPSGQPGWRPRCAFKRYWQRELWERLFCDLLNPPTWDAAPPLGELRRAFEAHLLDKARALRTALVKQDLMMADRART